MASVKLPWYVNIVHRHSFATLVSELQRWEILFLPSHWRGPFIVAVQVSSGMHFPFIFIILSFDCNGYGEGRIL